MVASSWEQSQGVFIHQDVTTIRNLCASQLRLFATLCKGLSEMPYGVSGELCTTAKVHKLQEILEEQLRSDRPLCGLVFVERRYTAVGLCELLMELEKRNGFLGSKIKCGYLTGRCDAID